MTMKMFSEPTSIVTPLRSKYQQSIIQFINDHKTGQFFTRMKHVYSFWILPIAIVLLFQSNICSAQCYGTTSVCINGTGTYQYSGSSSKIRWSISGGGTIIGSTASKNISVNWTSAGTRYVYLSDLMNSNGDCSITVLVKDAVGGSISANQTTVCQGSSPTLSLNGYMGTIVQWERSVNGGAWQAISNTTANHTESNIQSRTSFRALVGNCSRQVYSSSATIEVEVPNPGNITIISGSNAFCTGSSTTGTLQLNNYSGDIRRWEKSELLSGSWSSWSTAARTSTTMTFTASVPTRYRAVVRGLICVAEVASNYFAVNETPGTTAGVISSTKASPVCTNDVFSLNISGNVGTVLRWEKWDEIHGWSILSSPSNLSILMDSKFRAVVQNGGCPSKTTSEITMNVKPALDPGTINGSQTICYDSDVSPFFSTPAANGNIYSYQWQVRLSGQDWLDIDGATNESYDHGKVTQMTEFRRKVTSCDQTAYTLPITISIYSAPTAGTIGSDQTVCKDSDVEPFTATAPTGGNQIYTYKWQSADTNGIWTDILNATDANYDHGIVSTFRQFRRAVTSCGQTAYSEPVAVQVDEKSVGGQIGPAAEAYGAVSGSLSLQGNVGSVQKWQKKPENGSWSDIVNNNETLVYTNVGSTTTFIAWLKNGVCPAVPSNEVTITVYPVPSFRVDGSDVIAPGSTTSLVTDEGLQMYEWYVDNQLIPDHASYRLTVKKPGAYKVTVKRTSSSLPYTTGEIIISEAMDAQVDPINFIKSVEFSRAGITSQPNLYDLIPEDYTQTVQYFDGLGRPIQSVILGNSPGGNDVVNVSYYDELGRQALKYLPFSRDVRDGRYLVGPLSEQSSFYQDSDDRIENDLSPFAKTIFEPSPLGRILKSGHAGQAWQPDATDADDVDYGNAVDRVLKYDYGSNTSDEVLDWRYADRGGDSLGIVNAGSASDPLYLDSLQLFKNKTKDEGNNEAIEYIDKLGRTVLKKVQVSETEYAQTYYIYNDFNALVCVIPPEAVKRILAMPSQYFGKTDEEKEDFLNRWTFRYKYDARKRVIIKKVPGAKPVYMVYDKRDRLVLTQDGNQRATAPYYWTFTKYDELNRPILTGIKDTAANVSQSDMQFVINDHYSKPGAVWGETYIGTGIHGYTNKTYPVTTSDTIADPNHYLTITYYDNYDFRNLWLDSYVYSNEGLAETVNGVVYSQPAKETSHVRGQVTGTKVKVLDGGVRGGYIWLKSVNYFDDKYRLVQSVADNYKGGKDRTTNLYDFVGNVLQTKTEHSTNEISWQDLENAVAVGNNINKVLVSNGWSTGGMTAQQLPAGADGWIEYIISDPNQITAFGLSEGHEDHRHITMDYCFYLNLGVGQVYENGNWREDFPNTVESGDVVRIERVGTNMNYYLNGALVHTTNGASSAALKGDVSINTRLGNVVAPRASFSARADSVMRRFVYDHAGRLTEVWHGINGPPNVRIVHNEYNELGQLIDKKLHSSAPSASDAVQSVDYVYNIRGWLTHMNNEDLSSGGASEPTDYFSFQLAYQDVETGLNNVPAFNGNISAMKWASNLGIGDEKMRAYSYLYDKMNRITGATFKTATGLPNSLSWSTPLNEAFSATGYEYDLNGNILGLIRKGKDGNEIDSLKYDYGTGNLQSNVLLSVTDDASKSEGFTEIVSEGNDYEYDENGNLVWDKNKGGEDVLQNGDFSEGSSGWVISDTGGRLTFENDSVSITSHATASATLRQDDIIRPRAVYVVIVDVDRQAGNFSISLGNGGNKWIATSGKTVFTDDAGGGDDFVVTIPPSFVGQIKSIEVKGIVVIGYNYLNLPERIVKGLQQSMGYIYDATGRKISQEVYDEQGLIVKKSDYEGEFFYENDTLRFINHEEGRAIISDAAPEYQYHQKDHLGNVRLTFTTKEEIEATKATLEPENFDNEYSNFVRYENARKVQSYFFDRTNGVSPSTVTGYAQRLNGGTNEKFGLGRSLSVMPGDKIAAEVYVKYVDPEAGSRTDGFNSLLSQIAQQIASGATTSGLVIDGSSFTTSTTSFPFPTEAGRNTAGSSGVGPKAYLNWLVFDRDYNFLISESGYMRLSALPKESGQDVAHERLYSPEIVIEQAGYVYIYLSNENETPVEVYFDDFKVEHEKSPVVQMEDYYPFGLTFNYYQRENSLEQNHLYNSKEVENELDLGWYDYGARMYDTETGRWRTQDRKAEYYFATSPYVYALNQPTNAIDPDGNVVIFINGNHFGFSAPGASYWRGTEYVRVGATYAGQRYGEMFYRPVYEARLVSFDGRVMDQLGDQNARYYDGSGGGWHPFIGRSVASTAGGRSLLGYANGARDAKDIIDNLARDKNGNIVETIKIVTHSMGGAYGKGFVAALKAYIRILPKEQQKQILISLVADFDPYQAGDLTADPDIKTMQFIHKNQWNIGGMGWLANEEQQGIDQNDVHTNTGSSTDHSIFTFLNDISKLQEGTYTWDGEKWVKQ